ncbi:MAG: outer membrane beta-barrel protein, partial [Prevotella sp.]|nr:outer membrane beta-barrel protein [Prevotella sp.]
STTKNVAKSLSEGLEVVLKNRLFRILDLTTTANAYYYKINGFSYDIDGQTITGKEDHNFSFNARMTASVTLPYDISVQLNGFYRARQVITQGYRKPSYGLDFGMRKNFFNKMFTLSINCRDVLNSRRWENFTESDTFTRHQLNRRRSRSVNFTLTYNFGNQTLKKRQREEMNNNEEEEPSSNYNGGGGDD